MSHGLDRDSMALSNYLNDFIARDQGESQFFFLELDTHDCHWSELIQKFIEPDGYHRQTNSELELEPVGSWIGPQPIPTIPKKCFVKFDAANGTEKCIFVQLGSRY